MSVQVEHWDIPFWSRDSSSGCLSRLDTRFIHHVVSWIKVLSVLWYQLDSIAICGGHTFCILVKTFFPGTFPYSLNAFWSSSLIDYKSALLAAYTGSRSSPRYQPCSTGSAKTSRGEIVNTYQLVRVHFWRCTFALVQMLSPALCYASNRLRFRLPSVLSLPQWWR